MIFVDKSQYLRNNNLLLTISECGLVTRGRQINGRFITAALLQLTPIYLRIIRRRRGEYPEVEVFVHRYSPSPSVLVYYIGDYLKTMLLKNR